MVKQSLQTLGYLIAMDLSIMLSWLLTGLSMNPKGAKLVSILAVGPFGSVVTKFGLPLWVAGLFQQILLAILVFTIVYRELRSFLGYLTMVSIAFVPTLAIVNYPSPPEGIFPIASKALLFSAVVGLVSAVPIVREKFLEIPYWILFGLIFISIHLNFWLPFKNG